MYFTVKSVTPLDEFKLSLIFSNGEERLFDCSPYLSIGKFQELRDVSLFKSVTVRFDSVEWSNHLDLDPEFLYKKSLRVKKQHITRRTTGHAKATR